MVRVTVRDVLIFTPVYRLEAETVQSLMALEWDGDGLTKERSAITLLLQRDNPSGNPWLDHLHQYQRGREVFLQGSYEGMLVIESDVVVPVDTLWRLDALGCDVAYGAYVFRSQKDEGGRRKKTVVNVLERYGGWPNQARNIGESLTVRGLWDGAKRMGIVDCSGSGLGCVLIRREVLEAVDFREPKDPGFCDMDWTERVYRMGFRMRADCNLICGHKDVDGEVLWPR